MNKFNLANEEATKDLGKIIAKEISDITVSYTHLTLPTTSPV